MELSPYISNLRIMGLLAGLSMVVLTFFRLRHHSEKRTDVAAYSLFGISLIIVSIYPPLVEIPSELINLSKESNGRLITLLIISVVFLFLFWIDERSKRKVLDLQLDRLVRGLAISGFWSTYKGNIPSRSIVILMPSYNEAENLSRLLPKVPTCINGLPVVVLVVNDGSSDDTPKVAESNGAVVVSNPVNRGQGAALRLGCDIIAELNLEGVVISMDADGQHHASDIPNLILPILNEEADIVIGSRCLGTRESDSAMRYIGINVYNAVIRLLTGYKVSDCSSGFRAFNPKVLGKLNLRQNQYQAPELIIDATKKGYRIAECPITVTKRIHGISKKGTTLCYGFNFLRSIIKTWLR